MAAPTPVANPPRTRRRRWLRTLTWIVGLAVAARLLLWLALPLVLERAAEAFDLDYEVGELSLSLRTGQLELHDLVLLPKHPSTRGATPPAPRAPDGAPDGAPVGASTPAGADADVFRDSLAADGRVGALDYLLVDIDMQALLSGRLHAERIDVDGLTILVALPPKPAADPSASPQDAADTRAARARHEAAPTPGRDAGREPIPTDLTLPFSLDALRVQHARCLLRDESVSPPLATELSLDVRVSDVGSTKAPARLLVRAEASGVLDELRIDGTLSGDRSRQEGVLTVVLRGMHPGALAGYLARASAAPVAERLGLRFSLTGGARASGEHGELCSAELALDGLQLDADGRTAFALQSLRLDVPSLAGAARGVLRTELGVLNLTGLHAAVERLPSGAWRVAGLDLLPAATDAGAADAVAAAGSAGDADTARASQDAAPPSDATTPAAPSEATPWRLARLALRDVQLDVHDGTVVPATDLSVQLAALELGPLQSDAGTESDPAQLSATLHAPGLCDTLEVTGSLAPFGPEASADLSLQSTGLTLRRAEPYLRAAGLRSLLQQGALGLHVQAQTGTDEQGAVTASVRITDLLLRDGDNTLLSLPVVAFDGLVAAADGSSVVLRDVDIAGPALDLRRDADGALHLLGLATLSAAELDAASGGAAAPAERQDASSAATAQATAQAAGPAGPRLLLGQLRWHDVALHVRDEAVAPPIDLNLHDVGLNLSDLAIGGDPAHGDSRTGKLALWLGAEGILQRLELQGAVQSRPGPLDLTADLSLQVTGVQGGQAAAWMEAAGWQSAWADGRLALALHAAVAQREDALHADVELTQLSLDNGGQRWLALQRLSLGAVQLGAEGLQVGAIELSGFDVRAERDAEGGMLFAGVRVPPPVAPVTPVAPVAPVAATGDVPMTDDAAQADDDTAPMRIVVARVALDDVHVQFNDAAVSPAADLSAGMALHVSGFDTASPPGGAPAAFDLSLAVPGTLESLALQGDVLLTPDSQRLHAALLARGLAAGGLSAYLPPGLRCELRDGRLALQVDALHGPATAGGERFDVALHDVLLRDGPEGETVFALSRLACVAPRVDLDGGVVDLEEVSLRGVQLAAHRGDDAEVHALGFAFGSAPDVAAQGATGDMASAAQGVASGAPPSAARRGESALAALPEARLKTLDVEFEHLSWRDESQPGQPEVLAHLHLFNPAPLELIGRDPESLAPWELTCEVGANPVIEALTIGLRLQPFAMQPSLELSLAGHGIQGAGLTALVPSLAGSVDGSELVDGTLGAQLEAQLQWPRRSPVDFDLSHGFGLRLALSGLELRDRPQGELLAGLDGLELEVARISPASGDVHVERLELRTPHALVVNREDGLHVLGLRLLSAAADSGTQAADAPTVPPPAASGGVASGGAASDVAAAARAPEVRIDAATITGLDLQFRDETLTPPLLLPIQSLDAELTGFSTSAQAARPMRFGVFVGAGDVPLPKPVKSSSVLAGLTKATIASISGADESRTQIEERPVFQEISLTGRLTNGPSPKGWAQLNISALELMSFASAAKSAGVVIGDGVLDASVKLRFLGAEGVSIDSSTTLTDLSLSEPANGPVSQYLKLPAPLDTVVFLLRDEQERIVLDINLDSGAAGVSGSGLAREAAATLGALSTRAVASSPLRLTGTLTDAIGVTGGQSSVQAEVPTLLEFGVGDAALQPEQMQQLAPLVARLAADEDLTLVLEHVLGEGDVAQAELLANPPDEETLQVVERLRQMRGELQRRRDELAAQVSSFYAVGRESDAAAASEQLRGVDHDLGVLEQGLDRVLDLLRPGAGRRADHRTREAALALGNQRLATVAAALKQAGLKDSLSVIEVRPARWQVAAGESGGHVALIPRSRPRPQGLFSRWFGWMWPF